MNIGTGYLSAGMVGLGLLAGCSNHYHSRVSERRSYDPYYDVRTAGSERGPWRDENGDLHHNPDWKADSDRGRDSNDRDDPSRRGY